MQHINTILITGIESSSMKFNYRQIMIKNQLIMCKKTYEKFTKIQKYLQI